MKSPVDLLPLIFFFDFKQLILGHMQALQVQVQRMQAERELS